MNPANELLALYRSYGYQQYKMSKFEEYDLYAGNRDFLTSNRIITFTDTNGKLMALKPDVTLSIIKNSKDVSGYCQKVFYDESVYRVSKGTSQFKEIHQVGLESIGDLDRYGISEVLSLALASLSKITDQYVLEVSSLSVISSVLAPADLSDDVLERVMKAVSQKNRHELSEILSEAAAPSYVIENMTALLSLYGTPDQILPKLSELVPADVFRDFREVLLAIPENFAEKIRIDFSVVGDTKYYNDFIFKGFVEEIPSAVLSGGQYHELMRRMGRTSGAIGFAVYLDLLERFRETPRKFDCDTVLLYNKEENLSLLNRTVSKLSETGTVWAGTVLPEGLRARRILKLVNGEVKEVE